MRRIGITERIAACECVGRYQSEAMPMRIAAPAQMSVAARRPSPRNRHMRTRNPRPAMIGTAARTVILTRSESDGGM
jgi:hypothetical protein